VEDKEPKVKDGEENERKVSDRQTNTQTDKQTKRQRDK
jgi:hypothetical protein